MFTTIEFYEIILQMVNVKYLIIPIPLISDITDNLLQTYSYEFQDWNSFNQMSTELYQV